MRIGARLRKIEAEFGRSSPKTQHTFEERRVAGLELTVAILASGRRPELHAQCTALANDIATDILSQARRQAEDQSRRHVDGRVTEMWLASGHRLPFVSPVIGSEYRDWDYPNLAAWR